MAKRKKTSEIKNFTKYEKARILGSRALQISMGAPYLVKISKKKLEEVRYNPLSIARLEFDAGVIPITVVRPLPKIEREEEKA
jgi:DNA-directed RNA polymerase subunit K/omega